MSDSDEFEAVKTIAGLVEDDSDEEEIITPAMPVFFLSHGAGPSLLMGTEGTPHFEGMDKVGDPSAPP